jgi:hemolysin III
MKNEVLLARMDHAGIFLMIGGSYTPATTLALSNSFWFLFLSWASVLYGVYLAFLPRPNTLKNTIIYIFVGALIGPVLPELFSNYQSHEIFFQSLAWTAYLIGGYVYTFKIFDFWPKVFGYHEVFHLLTIVGSCSGYLVTLSLVSRLQ